MRSKNDYLAGVVFAQKSYRSHLQIYGYSNYLEQRDISVEGLLSHFFKNYLNELYGLSDIRFNYPSKQSTSLEKVRLIAPEIESILKQFKLFAEDGHVDHELLQIDSRGLSIKSVPSLVHKKYAYGYGDEFRKLAYLFFSDQSMLSYVDPFKEKYQDLYSLLINEKIQLNSFEQYQRGAIDWLVEEGYLDIDSAGNLIIIQDIKIALIGILDRDEVLSYWSFPKDVRDVIDQLENEQLVYYGNSLLTESEVKYLNYHLNQAEFTNGMDLRNKYSHGTNTHSENQQLNDYFILLKLLVLIALKIEDDLLINQSCRKFTR